MHIFILAVNNFCFTAHLTFCCWIWAYFSSVCLKQNISIVTSNEIGCKFLFQLCVVHTVEKMAAVYNWCHYIQNWQLFVSTIHEHKTPVFLEGMEDLLIEGVRRCPSNQKKKSVFDHSKTRLVLFHLHKKTNLLASNFWLDWQNEYKAYLKTHVVHQEFYLLRNRKRCMCMLNILFK